MVYLMKNTLGKLDEYGFFSQIVIELNEFEIHYKPLWAIKEQAYVDFIVDYTQEPTSQLEALVPVSIMVIPIPYL